ncbi:TetR family transcriptional regulator [Salinicoccus kekensis]|uniref:TetR family transcriptional regulator n=1 Tax=Salinicoccus kekensis TaxID=714307 RepID=A0A285UKG2_9STAP|nr:TetR family transcriptional regulator [Salinicoccus kekensis]
MMKEKSAEEKIKDAVVCLLQEKQFHKITITDVIKTAGINRSTYYYHYYELEKVLNEIIDVTIEELVRKMEESIQEPEVYNVSDQTLPSTLIMFKHIYEYKKYYVSLLNSDVSNQFSEKFIEAVKHFNRNLEVTFINPADVEIDYDMYTNFYAYAAFGQVQYWLKSGFKQTPEDMAEQLTHFLFLKLESIKVV